MNEQPFGSLEEQYQPIDPVDKPAENVVRDKVDIIATGYRWEDCIWDLPDHEYWTLNNMHGPDFIGNHRIDLWFQMHIPGSGEGHIDDEDHIQFLRQLEGPPVMMQHQFPEFPRSKRYPIEEVIKRFCPPNVNGHSQPYFTNSVDFMLCLAMLQGFKQIWLWGVEFVSSFDDEYYKMRQSCEYYIGQAKGMGIPVWIQDHSSICKAEYFYAYQKKPKDPIKDTLKQNLAKLKKERQAIEQQVRELSAQVQTMDGAQQAMDQTIKMLNLRARGVQL